MKNIKRLELIDFLKGYSIFTIVLFHLLMKYPLPNLLNKLINFGGAGVHVFVLCSGFGLYLSHLNKPLPYVIFLKKRFVKVYIPFTIIILISFFISLVEESENLYALLGNLFLFKMFDDSINTAYGGHMWFVSMIFQFYLCFPLIIFFFNKITACGKRLLLALLISLSWSSLVGYLGYSDIRVWNSFFLQYLWEFVLGMELARIYFRDSDTLKIPSKTLLSILSMIGIALVGYSGLKGGIWKLYNDIPSLIGYLSLALLFYSMKIRWLNTFFISTSHFSYDLYLVHGLVFSLIFSLPESNFSIIVKCVIALPTSYLVAKLYSKLIKRILRYFYS